MVETTLSPAQTVSPPLLLEMRKIEKAYEGVQVLKGARLAVAQGEIHGLVGENGAGKSTLVKILAGEVARDSGEITWLGRGAAGGGGGVLRGRRPAQRARDSGRFRGAPVGRVCGGRRPRPRPARRGDRPRGPYAAPLVRRAHPRDGRARAPGLLPASRVERGRC